MYTCNKQDNTIDKNKKYTISSLDIYLDPTLKVYTCI